MCCIMCQQKVLPVVCFLGSLITGYGRTRERRKIGNGSTWCTEREGLSTALLHWRNAIKGSDSGLAVQHSHSHSTHTAMCAFVPILSAAFWSSVPLVISQITISSVSTDCVVCCVLDSWFVFTLCKLLLQPEQRDNLS